MSDIKKDLTRKKLWQETLNTYLNKGWENAIQAADNAVIAYDRRFYKGESTPISLNKDDLKELVAHIDNLGEDIYMIKDLFKDKPDMVSIPFERATQVEHNVIRARQLLITIRDLK